MRLWCHPKPLRQSSKPAVVLCVLLALLLCPPSPGAETAAPLITQLKEQAFTKIAQGYGRIVRVDERGILFSGLVDTGEFLLGVHPTRSAADRVWQSINEEKPGEAAPEFPVDGLGERARSWRLPGINRFRVAWQRANVVIRFDWHGPTAEASAFARRLDEALQNDPELAPRGPQLAVPELEVLVPSVVAAGAPFPILYSYPRLRSAQTQIFLAAQGTDRLEPKQDAVSVEFAHTPTEPRSGRTQATLRTPGVHELTLTFVTTFGSVFQKSVRLRVLGEPEAAALKGAELWELPAKAIYLLPDAGARWEAIPEAQREQIRLEHQFLRPLNSQAELDQWRLRAWNELASVLLPAWLPPRELLRVFEDGSRPTADKVAYATYTRKNHHIIVMTEIGKQAWLYIEQPDPLPVRESPVQAKDVLAPDLTKETIGGDGKTIYPQVSFMARAFRRHRALSPDGPAEPVRVLLIHLGQAAQVHLNFPGYP